jgi:hypothetical protein
MFVHDANAASEPKNLDPNLHEATHIRRIPDVVSGSSRCKAARRIKHRCWDGDESLAPLF